MRLRLLALASLSLLAACASTEYSSVPEPTGEWVAVNPPGFQPLPLTLPVRPVRAAVRTYRHRPASPLRTAETTPPSASTAAKP